MKKINCWLPAIIYCFLLTAIQSKAQQFSDVVKQFIGVNSDTLALIHVKIIDGTGGASKSNQTILIIKGRINKIGNTESISVPSTVKIIDCTGKTIIPGMVMMHEHLFYGEPVAPIILGLEMPVSFPRLYLAGGVTTIRTTGSVEPQTDLNIRNDINDGKAIGPNIDVTGPYIEQSGLPIPEVLLIKSPEEVTKEVNYWKDMGCTSFKVYMDITKAEAEAAIDAAHKKGLKVTGHLCSITYREAADLGIDNLEHGFMVSTDFVPNKKENECARQGGTLSLMALDVNSPAMKDLMKFLIEKNVAITSTLPVFEPYTGREAFPGGGGDAVLQPVREVVEKGFNAAVGKDSAYAALFKKEMAWEKQFVEMGGRLMAGVDPTGAGRTIPGYADRHILELLVEAGFTFSQAVKICSLMLLNILEEKKRSEQLPKGKELTWC